MASYPRSGISLIAMQRIIYTRRLAEGLRDALAGRDFDRLFVVTDSNVERDVLPLLSEAIEGLRPRIISFPAGEENKNLSTLSDLWRALSEHDATRRSLLICLGGGVVTDLGGFAAATFKRGIRHINVPTTVLGAVDAAVGGKTGIDFLGLKNEIGAFAPAEAVVVSSEPFSTLPELEQQSGLAEIMKMAMISAPEDYYRILRGERDWEGMVRMAVGNKCRIVEEDPLERGLRRVLNFGHTAGHAFESLLLERGCPVSHGCAVAHGILVALILSRIVNKENPGSAPEARWMSRKEDSLSSPEGRLIYEYRDHFLRPNFSPLPLTCRDIDPLLALMRHDKKNIRSSLPKGDSGRERDAGPEITFVLLPRLGSPEIVAVPESDVRAALEIRCDLA